VNDMDRTILRFAPPMVPLLLVLSGCNVGPDFVPPKSEAPAEWSTSLEGGLKASSPEDLTHWWTTLHDPQLDSLIDRAVAGNLNLKEAQSRVVQARAQRGVIAADAFPQVDANAGYSRSRASENAGLRSQQGGVGQFQPSEGTDLYTVGFDAGWEIDIFGRNRRAVEAADAEIASLIESERDVLVTLLGEVARNYIEVRSFQNRLAITQSNIAVQQDTVDLARSRSAAGITSELDLARAEAQLNSTTSAIPSLEIGLAQAMNRLAVLLGRDPGSLKQELAASAPIPNAPDELPVGMPSDLLRRRPDIRAAERNAAAATARIGVATADLFPRISLVGSLGLESTQIGSLPSGDSRFWSIGPTLNWAVFDAGRIRSNIKVQEALTDQSLLAYDRTVLGAFEEVENSLVAYGRELVRRQSLVAAVAAGQRSVEMAKELNLRGLTDFLSVLDAQRQLFIDQELLAVSERNVAVNLVAVYKALGGGWEEAAQAQAQPQQSPPEAPAGG
jgi:NodT family efflux transporter outer membrane factor (OMF) lipoprotein